MEGMLAAGDILADAFELPVDWCQRLLGVGFARLTDATAFLALHDGRPVAVAGSALAGDVAGIYAVGTRLPTPPRRRRLGGDGGADHQMGAGAHWFGLLSARPPSLSTPGSASSPSTTRTRGCSGRCDVRPARRLRRASDPLAAAEPDEHGHHDDDLHTTASRRTARKPGDARLTIQAKFWPKNPMIT